ncbi:sulfatase-like hydrolase/transferase [Streptomyces massasporeus]|uniref:sulfatase-like hydrolase/transferase n=1 Tax=Streptomyces massasporeus TaxID=67324 RepID=UPI003451862D
MPNRRQFLAGSAAALALASLPATRAAAAPGAAAGRAPNIVLVLADDLGWGELGSYGQGLIATPRIDELAAQGLRFTRAYATAAVCAPSRCSLLTGLHTGHAAVRQNPFSGPQGSLGDGDTTFAEVLRSRGYRTACIGKWGFGPDLADQPSHPNARGFEEFYGYINHGHAHEYYPSYLWDNGEKADIPENADGARGRYAPDLIEQRALEFIDAHAAEPFLLFLTPTLPHAPSEIPDTGPYAGKPWSAADKAHAAQVTRLDTLVGKVVDRLEALGLGEDTLVLVASDNGPHQEGGVNPNTFDANGPLRGIKRNLYEGGVRVPLIARQPGKVRVGTTDRPTPLTDLLPTFAQLGGAPAPRDIDGISVAPLLTGPTVQWHDHLYWMRNDPYTTSLSDQADGGRGNRLAEAVRKGPLKAVRFAPARDRSAPDSQWQFELYDLAADPGEKTNIAASRPADVAALTALMRSSWADTSARRPHGLSLKGPGFAVRGGAFTVRATLGNASSSAWTSPGVTLTVPAGWQYRATTPTTQAQLAAGGSFTVSFEVTPPSTAALDTPFTLRADATAVYGGNTVRFGDREPVEVLATVPEPPTADTYVSDLEWARASNGWGPVERDRSNGKQGAGDGPAISLAGTTYTKGLGVHAPSEVVYYLGGRATRFTALVGIDDYSARMSDAGGVRATVFGDAAQLFDSLALTAAGGPKKVDVDITGVQVLRLVVRDANGNGSYDHTSWASALVEV